MTILALEFSSPQRSVAIARGETVLAEAVETGDGRGTNAFGLIEKVLAEAKINREQIDVLCIGLGPGSYTGIRSAIAIAQGWQLACEVKLTGISSAEAIAVQAQTEKVFGRVNVAVDAQRNEFYVAIYEISETERKEIRPLRILAFAELQSCAGSKEILVGPEVTRWFARGENLFPRASALAKLTAGKNNFVPGERLEPIYLRETNFVKASPSNTVVS